MVWYSISVTITYRNHCRDHNIPSTFILNHFISFFYYLFLCYPLPGSLFTNLQFTIFSSNQHQIYGAAAQFLHISATDRCKKRCLNEALNYNQISGWTHWIQTFLSILQVEHEHYQYIIYSQCFSVPHKIANLSVWHQIFVKTFLSHDAVPYLTCMQQTYPCTTVVHLSLTGRKCPWLVSKEASSANLFQTLLTKLSQPVFTLNMFTG